MLTFKGKKGNIKAGLECGYRANNAPNISQTIEMQYQDNGNIVKQKVTNSVNLKESGFYATPKVSAELKLGKKGNWSLIADADMYQGNAGIKYTF